jgi:hypothetical protein
VITSTELRVSATAGLPVMIQARINVSIVPVMRQVIALTILRRFCSIRKISAKGYRGMLVTALKIN